MQMVPREGIEPPTDDYKSTVIPFNYQGKGWIRIPQTMIGAVF